MDREVASVRLSVRPSVCFSALSTKSKEESLSVRGICLCVDLLRGSGRLAFNSFSAKDLCQSVDFLFKALSQIICGLQVFHTLVFQHKTNCCTVFR